MKNLICLFFLAITMLSLQSCDDKQAENYDTDVRNGDAVSFIDDATNGGLDVIKASGLAITNSNNQRVIGFAIMVIDDRTKAGDQLKHIAAGKGIIQKDTVNHPHQQVINDLSKKSGSAFDKAYIQMMVTDYEQDVKLFAGAARKEDAEISSFAAKKLTTIQMHLDSAYAILRSLK